ncbi:MAG: threonine-phosphate decarboxylase CobD [Leptospirales bacterium]
MLEHGGGIQEAARRYNIDPEHWLDLSTGINPMGWTAPSSIPPEIWRRLPEPDDGLETSALEYYNCANILPAAGSQAIIQAMPRLRKPGKVAVLSPGYAEHSHAWQKNGHTVIFASSKELEKLVHDTSVDVVVIINPNNPTGEMTSPEKLLAWRNVLAKRGAWLVVDEAFMDSTPEQSIFHYVNNSVSIPDSLIVLRSLGKFFGLAGVRVGFASASPDLLHQISDELGPWNVNGPARYIAQLALHDYAWHKKTRLRLQKDGLRLKQLLTKFDLTPTGDAILFQWSINSNARNIYETLAQNSILVRYFDKPKSIRIGLPPDDVSWSRLENAFLKL